MTGERAPQGEAVEALAAVLYEQQKTYSQPKWDAPDPPTGQPFLNDGRRKHWRNRATFLLQAPYSALRSSVLEELREELLSDKGALGERAIDKAKSAYAAFKQAADDPWDDTGWDEPWAEAVAAAIDYGLFSLADQHQEGEGGG